MRFKTRHGVADMPRGRSRLRRRAFAAVAVAVVAFGMVTARLFVWPAQGMPATVDAIVMLAGPGDRVPVALQLARQHRAAMLVVSRGWEGYGGPCPAPIPGVRLICFDPNPPDTRGEAGFTGRLEPDVGPAAVLLCIRAARMERAAGRQPPRLRQLPGDRPRDKSPARRWRAKERLSRPGGRRRSPAPDRSGRRRERRLPAPK